MAISKIMQQLINIAVRRGNHKEIKHLSTKDRLVTLKQYMLEHNLDNDVEIGNVLRKCYEAASVGQLTIEDDFAKKTYIKLINIFGKGQVEDIGKSYLISW